MTTLHPDPVIWFAGMGFRPAVWTPPHRADEVDPARLVPAPDADVAYLSKYDAPLVTASAPVSTPGLPWLAPITPGWPILPPDVDYPCMCIMPPVDPVEPAPVPVPASAGLLIAAVAVLMIVRVRR